MWFKKESKETHVYGNDPVVLTGRYYLSIESQTKYVEIIRDSRYTYWVPFDKLSEIRYEL